MRMARIASLSLRSNVLLVGQQEVLGDLLGDGGGALGTLVAALPMFCEAVEDGAGDAGKSSPPCS